MIATIAFVLVFLGQWSAFGAEQVHTVEELLQNASQYNGKPVHVSAVAVIEFENMALCSSHTLGNSRSCVWLEIDNGPDESASDQQRYNKALAYWSQFNGRQVLVRGVFTSGESGHFGMWPGAIGQVVQVSAP